MKIKMKHSLMMVFILLFFYGAIFSQGRGLLLLDFRENQLKERLQLTPQQVDLVKGIVKMLRSQASLDRQNFKSNALALVAAAVRRAQMAEMKLSNDLKDSQKAALRAIKEEQKKAGEFFSLKEGLILTEEQAVKIKSILQLYASQRPVRGDAYDSMADLYDPMGYGPGYGLQGNMPGVVPGTVPGTVQRDMVRARRPRGMRMNEGLIEKLRAHEAEKEKAIEPILTPEQKILFNQLKKVRHKELEIILEKIRTGRNSP